jgi:hypothetical protein
MSNATRGEFELALGGVPYRFKIGTAALELAQEQIGLETGTVPTVGELTKGLDDFRVRYVRIFLWAALRKYHREVTPAGVADILDDASEHEALALVQGLKGSTVPDARDLEALEAAGVDPIKPATAAAAAPTPIRGHGRGRSTSRRVRSA